MKSSSKRSQSTAQASHTSAQALHVSVWRGEPRSMKSALVRQMSTQSSIRPMCSGVAWGPPIAKQCMTVSRQVAWHS